MRTIPDFTKEILESFEGYDSTGTEPWNYEIASHDLSYQVGSLSKAVLQLNNKRHRSGKSDDEIKDTISDELADILSLVVFIAHELDIDLESAWEQMLVSDEKKVVNRS